MFSAIKIFITEEQKIELKCLHNTARDGRVRDRIKAILLASEGWNSVMIAQALHLHQTTVDRCINDYFDDRKLKSENGGSEGMLNTEQTELLINHLSLHLFHHTHEIVAYVAQCREIAFSIPNMNKWLHLHGFSYKKPTGVPYKCSEEKQRQTAQG